MMTLRRKESPFLQLTLGFKLLILARRTNHRANLLRITRIGRRVLPAPRRVTHVHAENVARGTWGVDEIFARMQDRKIVEEENTTFLLRDHQCVFVEKRHKSFDCQGLRLGHGRRTDIRGTYDDPVRSVLTKWIITLSSDAVMTGR